MRTERVELSRRFPVTRMRLGGVYQFRHVRTVRFRRPFHSRWRADGPDVSSQFPPHQKSNSSLVGSELCFFFVSSFNLQRPSSILSKSGSRNRADNDPCGILVYSKIVVRGAGPLSPRNLAKVALWISSGTRVLEDARAGPALKTSPSPRSFSGASVVGTSSSSFRAAAILFSSLRMLLIVVSSV